MVKVTLQYVKSTPGTHVYATNEPGVGVKQLYIKRDAFPFQPKSITVTVEAQQA